MLVVSGPADLTLNTNLSFYRVRRANCGGLLRGAKSSAPRRWEPALRGARWTVRWKRATASSTPVPPPILARACWASRAATSNLRSTRRPGRTQTARPIVAKNSNNNNNNNNNNHPELIPVKSLPQDDDDDNNGHAR